MAEGLMRREREMKLGKELFEQFEAVRMRYLDAMEITIIELDALLGAIDRPDIQEQALEGIRFRAHKISGTAETLGYPRIGELAHDVETAVDQRTSWSGSSQTKKIRALLEVLLEEMEQTLDAHMHAPQAASI